MQNEYKVANSGRQYLPPTSKQASAHCAGSDDEANGDERVKQVDRRLADAGRDANHSMSMAST